MTHRSVIVVFLKFWIVLRLRDFLELFNVPPVVKDTELRLRFKFTRDPVLLLVYAFDWILENTELEIVGERYWDLGGPSDVHEISGPQ